MTYNKKVIEFPYGIGKWEFEDFVFLDDSNPIENWYQCEISDEARLKFDGLLKDASKTDNPVHWIGFRRYMKGKLRRERIWELGFRADQRQYRILGKFSSERKHAILLIGCYHKNQVYNPTDALETAYKRSRALANGNAKLNGRKIKVNF